jgi:hypothetical protein
MSETQLFRVTEEQTPESVAHTKNALLSPMRAFEPHPLLRNPHVATAMAALWPRKL